jgi:RNA polymerase-binding transcription factor DksA
MTDIIDQANDHAEKMLAIQIARATQPKPRGLPACEDCGDAISEQRQDLGARLCVTCQGAAEVRALQAKGKRY